MARVLDLAMGGEQVEEHAAHQAAGLVGRHVALDAGMDALKRIVRNYNNDMKKLQFVDMVFYILRKDGAYAGVSLWTGYESGKPHQIVVHDGTRRAENTKPLFQGFSRDFTPEPKVPPEVEKQFR